MGDLVKIFYVVSTRNHRSGTVYYNVGDNYAEMPRGGRRIFGTGHYDRDVVMSRLRKCRNGEWFPEQHKTRKTHRRELERLVNRQRKQAHVDYLKSQKS